MPFGGTSASPPYVEGGVVSPECDCSGKYGGAHQSFWVVDLFLRTFLTANFVFMLNSFMSVSEVCRAPVL